MSMEDRIPAEAFRPGDFVKEELEARGWTQSDFAGILGVSFKTVNEIILGKRVITPVMAKAIGEAFGTNPQVWLNLESAFQLWQLRTQETTVARRAHLYSIAPLKELIKRRWIEDSDNIEVLEQRVRMFFGMKSLAEPVKSVPHAARKSTSYQEVTPAQKAWLIRARQLATSLTVKEFSEKRFAECVNALRALTKDVEETRRVPRVCADHGIRLVVVEHLPHTRIDGATFWLGATAPVVALSLRFDRIDWFWHTLAHELGHVKERAGQADPVLDTDLVGEKVATNSMRPEQEKAADAFAEAFAIPQKELDDFTVRVRPLYSKLSIRGFAARVGVHPGLVVGQLQYRGEIPYSHSRPMLERVRHIVVQSALTDGWGCSLPALI
jgi:HTH-type transcriptional regulator/antitoxin HigA